LVKNNIIITEACYGAKFIGYDTSNSMLLNSIHQNTLAYFAMNYNRQESKMQFYSNKDLAAQYAQQNTRFYEGNKGSIAHEVKENNRGIVLWKLCIIFALLFLLVEILLIRFWKTSSNN
jgi:hypothetical protein